MMALLVACFAMLSGQTQAEELYYIHTDHLGTPKVMTDEAKNTVWEVDYLPFGKVVEITNNIDQSKRFPGQYEDKESGYYYNYFRDYDPSLGRYLQSDPIGLSGGLNTYAYVEGNPLNRVDRYGLWSPKAHDTLIQYAFEGMLPQREIDIMKKSGREFDKNTQASNQSYMHSMRQKGESIEDAIRQRDQFINDNLSNICVGYPNNRDDQLKTFGEIVHPVMDKYSPEHRDINGNPKEWNPLWPFGHSPMEHIGNETVKDITPNVRDQVTRELIESYNSAF